MQKKCSAYTAIAGSLVVISLILGLGSIVKRSYAYTEIEVTNGGEIYGNITFEGDIPPAKMLEVDSDKKCCIHVEKPSKELIISDDSKGIKNAVVSIENIGTGKKKDSMGSEAILDQVGCEFIPHVLVIPEGTKVEIRNSDDCLHNIHTFALKNAPFNVAVLQNKTIRKRFRIPEVVRIKCDVHKWMSSYVVVVDSPYFAVTDEDGNYRIDNIPEGEYRLNVWHERLGTRVKDFTVNGGNNIKIDFKLSISE